MPKVIKTGFDNFVEKQLKNLEFRNAFKEAQQELAKKSQSPDRIIEIPTSLIESVLKSGLDISYRDLISAKLTLEEKFVVEYESYFNPHADPKQLMDQKIFDLAADAADFFINYIKDKQS